MLVNLVLLIHLQIFCYLKCFIDILPRSIHLPIFCYLKCFINILPRSRSRSRSIHSPILWYLSIHKFFVIWRVYLFNTFLLNFASNLAFWHFLQGTLDYIYFINIFVWTDYFPRWWLRSEDERAPKFACKTTFSHSHTNYRVKCSHHATK